MRSSVDAAAFYKAMTALMDIPAKSPVKVLQEIKVEFTADHCTLSATDFGTWLSVTIPASGDDFSSYFGTVPVSKRCAVTLRANWNWSCPAKGNHRS